MKLQLFSDYTDFYDPFFESKYELVSGERFSNLTERKDFSGEIKPFYRYAGLGHGLSRTNQFKELKKILGFKIIKNTECWNLELEKDEKVVVYLDEFSHCGDGKILTSVSEARRKYPEHRCSYFVKTCKSEFEAEMFKHVYIGNYKFIFRINSKNIPKDLNSWGTNNSENAITLINHKETINNYRPIYSVDFVKKYSKEPGSGNCPLAIDLNWAPGLHGLKIDEIFSGKEIVELITNWCEEKNWKSRKE